MLLPCAAACWRAAVSGRGCCGAQPRTLAPLLRPFSISQSIHPAARSLPMELKTGQFFAACPPSSPILANRHPRALDAWPPLSGACATATRLPADFTSGLAGLEAVDAACQMLCRGQPFEAAWPYSSGVHYLAGGPTLPPSLRLKEDWEFAKTYGIIVKPTVGGRGRTR